MRKFISYVLFFIGTVFTVGKVANTSEPYNIIAPSVVKVLNAAGNEGGTGFITTAKSGKTVLVTNWHVCNGVEANHQVHAVKESEYDVVLDVITEDITTDLCVTNAPPGVALKIAKNGPKKFDTIWAMGHPYLQPLKPVSGKYSGMISDGIYYTPNPGSVCALGFETIAGPFGFSCVRTMVLQDTTVPVFSGNSGSPVTNRDGEVIGVMNAADERTSFGVMIPLDRLKLILDTL